MVTKRPKPKRMVRCPTALEECFLCGGQREFLGHRCPVCKGRGRLPVLIVRAGS